MNAKLNSPIITNDKIKSILFGIAIGDALGVPVEFTSRQIIRMNPVKDMIGFGTFNLPPGTFSDDTSLSFCLAEALLKDFDLNLIANNFLRWYKENFWTARGTVFDIGIATKQSLLNLLSGLTPELAGSNDEYSNGNGSLMRIAPLLLYIYDKPINERFIITKQVSSITHRHNISVIACFYYLEFARQLILGYDKFDAYNKLQTKISNFLKSISISEAEIALFYRLLNRNIFELSDEYIESSGYVIHTLEASIWCLLTSDSYTEAVLKAVNLGNDTDTTGAVTGGLAALLYGYDSIPSVWVNQISRHNDIENLANRLCIKFINNQSQSILFDN